MTDTQSRQQRRAEARRAIKQGMTSTITTDEAGGAMSLAERLEAIRRQTADLSRDELLIELAMRDALIVSNDELLTVLKDVRAIDAELIANQDELIATQKAMIARLKGAA